MAWGSKKQSLIAEMISINPKLNEQDLMKLTRNQLRGRLYMLKKSEFTNDRSGLMDFNTKIDALISEGLVVSTELSEWLSKQQKEAKEQGMWLEPMFVRWTRQCSISSRS